VQFLDLLWPTLLLLNAERVDINYDPEQLTPLSFTYYPISHSLLMALIWALLFGIIYYLFRKNFKYALILFLCVFSHWLLDVLVHYPDLPLYPGDSPKLGLGLWSMPLLENAIEFLMFIIGVGIYLVATTAKNNAGKYVTWILILLLAVAYLANIFGPKPTDTKLVAWGAQLMWIFVALAFWADKNRVPKDETEN
jgi:membrane-bound metal-dependent hydrolase YbcI (DUF457 family)